VSNCQDGCQTNSRRYDDLLSTDCVDLSSTYRVIVLVTGGSTVSHPWRSAGLLVLSGEWQKVMQKAVRWPCGVCGRGVCNNSIQCTSCKKWVHRKCSGIKGSMYKVMKSFICKGCVNPVTGTGRTSVDIGGDANLELVDK